MACGKQIAWQYLPDPAGLTFDNWIIKYYDGSSTQTIRSHGPVGQRSLRLHNGQLVWRELAPKPINEDRVFFFDGENIHQVAALPNPAPAEAPADSRFWTEIHEVDVNLGRVVWSATEVECVLRIGTLCLYQPTGNIGVFTNASGETTVEVLKTSFIGGSLGGFDFDNGLLAFFASFTPAAPDIYTYPLFSTETATNAALILTDTTPKPSILVTRGEPSVVVDGFKVSVLPRNCGALLGEEVEITSLTFEGRARSGIDANLLDITSVRLYWDINADGDLADDPLVGEGTFDDSTLTFTLAPPMTVLPGDEEHFLLSFELEESICPCNTYEALLSAGNIEAFTTQTQVRPTRVGSSRGRIVLPEPRFATFSSEEMFGGDEQAGFAETTLPDRLGVRVENFPIDCGQASFKIVPIAGVGLNNALLRDSQSQSPRLVLPFRQENGDAVADVEMTLGDQDGLYAVEATIEFIEPADCKSPRHIFREHAGRIVLEVVDVKNPQFYDATPVSGGPSPWDVKITSDFERLATGGDTRVATTTDGVSMLLIRAKLIGFPEAPPGDVEFSLSGGGDVGSLIASFGGSVPPAAGATSVGSPWREEHGLIKSFALYTPPPNYGEDPSTERALTLTAKYSLPADPGNVQEVATDVALFRPPILFVHGMWSNMNTWGTAYTQSTPRYEKYYADYSGGEPSGNAVSFSENGTVIRDAVYGIVQDRGSRGIATTQAVVVAHSMGGLLTRQFIADQGGLSYRRPDNIGQGDIDKFITMGTPHWGSPISWLTKSLRESTNPLIQQPFLELINGIGLDIFSGAIDSMCPGSPQLQALGESVVPAHAIQGWYLDTSDPDLADDAFSLILLEITQDLRSGKPLTPLTVLLKVLDIAGTIATSLLYSFDKTDLLVTNLSQGSDLIPQQRSEFDRTTHMALGLDLSPVIESETESQEIAERVFALVDAPVDGMNGLDRYPIQYHVIYSLCPFCLLKPVALRHSRHDSSNFSFQAV